MPSVSASACAATPATYPDGRPRGTSMHGWGKAVDFSEPRGITFSSPGYRFLKAQGAAVGWNHPGWAEPGGAVEAVELPDRRWALGSILGGVLLLRPTPPGR